MPSALRKRDIKQQDKQQPAPVQPSRQESYASNSVTLENNCQRCKISSRKRAATDFHICDIGQKVIFRSISRRCKEQSNLLQGRATDEERLDRFRAFVQAQARQTCIDVEADLDEMATLMLAFHDVRFALEYRSSFNLQRARAELFDTV